MKTLVRHLDYAQFLHVLEVFLVPDLEADPSTLGVLLRCVYDRQDRVGQSTLVSCPDRFVTQHETHEEISLPWSQVQDCPFLLLQP